MTDTASTPRAARLPRMQAFTRWLEDERGLRFDSYEALWRWSVADADAFWGALWAFFDLHSPTPALGVLEHAAMPGARWFPGVQLNFARQVLRHGPALHAAGHPALVFASEREPVPATLSWPELERQVAAFAGTLRAAGVARGDRVCAWLPHAPAAIVAFLGCASIGAIWSLASPDMGPVAVLDRFRQIEPKVLVAVDGQAWGGQVHDRRAVLRELLAGLPSVQMLVLDGFLPQGDPPATYATTGRHVTTWAEATAAPLPPAWAPEWLPFDHPLWIVYSSGTTGLPKPIVHGHGGIVIETLKGSLHNDVAPTLETGERFFWFSTTGWIMWNAGVAALLGGTTLAIYDGNPGGPARAPDWDTLWRFAAAAGVTWFGAGAAFYASCMKAGIEPMRAADLSRVHAIGSTGSPLPEEAYDWIWQQLPRQADGSPVWIAAISGGTDFCGAFVAGNRLLPQVRGEMQCRCLGAAVFAWSEDGRELEGEVGELVCTKPLPSMPLFFWGDTDGSRYRESYFEMFPGVWRHGDWLRIVPHPESGSAGAVIYGRSDATINRHGVRMGTAELYRAVEALPEVLDSLVVDLEYLGRESWMPLFVVLREGLVLGPPLQARLREAIKAALSPRHVPSEICQVPAIPRTLSGKKMELPVKKLLMGEPAARVLKRDAMANADSIDFFVALGARRAAAGTGS